MEQSAAQSIEKLEAVIETTAKTIEWCRKFILLSKALMILGGLWLAIIATGIARMSPHDLIFAVTAIIAGIVGFGTNRSTAQRAAERLEAAERMRSQLIDGLGLREVDSGRR